MSLSETGATAPEIASAILDTFLVANRTSLPRFIYDTLSLSVVYTEVHMSKSIEMHAEGFWAMGN